MMLDLLLDAALYFEFDKNVTQHCDLEAAALTSEGGLFLL